MRNRNLAPARLKHARGRAFVVWPMTPGSVKQPRLVVFSDREDARALSTQMGATLCPISTEPLDGLVAPALVEQSRDADPDKARFYPDLKLRAPGDAAADIAGGGKYAEQTVTRASPLMQRAIQSTSHPVFAKWILPRAENPVDPDLLTKRQGEEIFKSLQKNATQVSEFHGHQRKLITCFQHFLDRSGYYDELPAIRHGSPLAGGLPELLIDFVLRDDLHAPMTVAELESQLDLDVDDEPDGAISVWKRVIKNNPHLMKLLADRFTIFRNSVLSLPQHGLRPSAGAETLGTFAEEILESAPEIKELCARARTGASGIRQTLRSRILPSFLVSWVIEAAYSLPEVRAHREGADQDRAVTELILRDGKGVVAKPIPRLREKDLTELDCEWTENRERVLDALLASARDPRAIDRVPEHLAGTVQKLAGDPRVIKVLQVLGGGENGDARQRLAALKRSLRGLMKDIIMPRLVRTPRFFQPDLEETWSDAVRAMLLEAVLIDDDGMQRFNELATKYQNDFGESVVAKDGSRRVDAGARKVEAELLTDFLRSLADERAQDAIALYDRVSAALTDRRALGGAAAYADYPTVPVNGEFPQLRSALSGPGKREVTSSTNAVAEAAIVRVAANKQSAAKEASAQPPAASAPATAVDSGEKNHAQNSQESPAPETNSDDGDQSALLAMAIDQILESGFDPEKRELAAELATKLEQHEPFRARLRENKLAIAEALSVIYQRFVERPDRAGFRGSVNRLTLAGIMRSLGHELNLGDEHSFIHRLVLDLFEEMTTGDEADLRRFLKKYSFTLYILNHLIEKGTLGAFRRQLRHQAEQSLASTRRFMCDVIGFRYLLQQLAGRKDVEIILFDGTVVQFTDWLKTQVSGNEQKQVQHYGFRPEHLMENSAPSCLPAVVYFADSAFASAGQTTEAKIAHLGEMLSPSSRRDIYHDETYGFSQVLPPLLVSVTERPEEVTTDRAAALSEAAKNSGLPLSLLGPRLPLNRPEDSFETYLPLGYPKIVSLLGGPIGELRAPPNAVRSYGRFHAAWTTNAPLGSEGFGRVIWGGPGVTGLGIDHYLFVVLLLLHAGKGLRREEAKAVLEELACRVPFNSDYLSWRSLNPALIAGNAARLCLGLGDDPQLPLQHVYVADGPTLFGEGPAAQLPSHFKVEDVEWFRQVRALLEI